MIRGAGPYCTLITPQAGSLFHAVFHPFPKPASGRISVNVINHLGDEVMKVFGVK